MLAPTETPELRSRRSRFSTNSQQMLSFVVNFMTSRMDWLRRQQLDRKHDINKECGYPDIILPWDYVRLNDRLGEARRVNSLFPEECWAQEPCIYDSEDADETPWEQALKDLDEEHNLFSIFETLDIQAGIGHYGILLIGINDGKELSQPIDGFNTDGTVTEGKREHKLLYLIPFNEYIAEIGDVEKDERNPRYGMPLYYNIRMDDPTQQTTSGARVVSWKQVQVHWSRVVHVVDNRQSSRVYGVPRTKPVYDRLLDIRKIVSGSGEMFWNGGFPGLSLETHPQIPDAQIDRASLSKEVSAYLDGLKRVLVLEGMKANSLAQQISDPAPHYTTMMQSIGTTLNIPMRILMGSERGELASSQDAKKWNRTILKRCRRQCAPYIVKPIIQRFIDLGVLPPPNEGKFYVHWEDMESLTQAEQAEILAKQMEAISKYTQGGVSTLIPPFEFLTMWLHLEEDEANAILDAASEHLESMKDPDQVTPGQNPTPPPMPEDGEGGPPQNDRNRRPAPASAE